MMKKVSKMRHPMEGEITIEDDSEKEAGTHVPQDSEKLLRQPKKEKEMASFVEGIPKQHWASSSQVFRTANLTWFFVNGVFSS